MKKRLFSGAFLVSSLAYVLLADICALSAAELSYSLVTDRAPGRAARHGLEKLKLALVEKGITLEELSDLKQAKGQVRIVAGLGDGPGAASRLLSELRLVAPADPEALLIRHVRSEGNKILLVSGADDRGLMYALLEVADRIGWATARDDPLSEVRDAMEKPAVPERALSIYTMQRAHFESRFYHDAHWARYFDMLAQNRFNTVALLFAYEAAGYFAPAYPWFFDVEGFPDVRVVGLSKEEQQLNLKTLNHLIEMAHDRGLNVTIGLWDHIYRGGVQSGGVKDADPNQPRPGLVWGLTTTNLMAYSKGALAKFFKLVPRMDAVQFRMHNESGLKAGQEMYEFWKTIYQVVKENRPQIRFDARAKGFPDELIDLALEMGVNIRICTKYWMEQMGLPFHPSHIPRQNQFDRRHGYADLLRYPQRYKMHWRLWNGGTTRILLWGDPEYVRRFVESTQLYNGEGFEVNEMLATKMASQPHDQKPFQLLTPSYQYYNWEFERYWHFFQVFGRIAYNPKTPEELWDKEFERRFGKEAAPNVKRGLHRASQILPRIIASVFPYNRFPTTRGWAEKQRWEDLPGYIRAEGSDTEQFIGFQQAARERLEGGESAQVHPEQNSLWLAKVSKEVLQGVDEAEKRIGRHRNKEFDSTMVDLKILAHLAAYHSRRIHAGLHYAFYKQSHDLNALEEAVQHERHAIAAWEQLVAAAGDVYNADLMMGLRGSGLSGHWRDELEALRKGLQDLETEARNFQLPPTSGLTIAHVPIRRSTPGEPLEIRATISGPYPIAAARLAYRRSNSDFDYLPMEKIGSLRFRVLAPASKLRKGTAYYLEATDASGARATFPGPDRPIEVIVSSDREPPILEHAPITSAPAGKPLKLKATVRDPSGVKWVRLRYRSVTQYQDYRTILMMQTAKDGGYEAVVPGEEIVSKWDFMYFFETMDREGNGKLYPDLESQTPYVIVKLER